jgi:outer membrane murein-binding lipoprotein Lpp
MRAARVWVAGLFGVVAVAMLSVYLGAAENQSPVAKPMDLEKRVATLEEKVAELEKKLDQLAHAALPAVPPMATAPQPYLPNSPQTLPPSAVPREFNGQTYYLLPLGNAAR